MDYKIKQVKWKYKWQGKGLVKTLKKSLRLKMNIEKKNGREIKSSASVGTKY